MASPYLTDGSFAYLANEMGGKEKKSRNLIQDLEQRERELFLDAFYQSSGETKKKYKISHNKNPKEVFTVEEESALFLQAANQLTARWPVKKDDQVQKTAVRRPRKRRRCAVDADLDLHGMYPEDAVKALFRFLDRQRGSRTVLVVHGKGAGVLKNVVLSCLGSHEAVKDFRQAPPNLGGSGAILVRLA